MIAIFKNTNLQDKVIVIYKEKITEYMAKKNCRGCEKYF